METKLLEPNRENIETAAEIIRRGGLVAFPTETVYGLGADAFNATAVSAVYAAKGRPSDNPLIVHIADSAELARLTPVVTDVMKRLADRFWPGPLTMVVKRLPNVPDVTTGGLETVAVRLPDNEATRALIAVSGCPLVGPSANLSGKPSPTKAQHVVDDLYGKIDAVLMGDDCRVGIESTVLDVSTGTDTLTILRPGIITPEQIEAAVGLPVRFDPALTKIKAVVHTESSHTQQQIKKNSDVTEMAGHTGSAHTQERAIKSDEGIGLAGHTEDVHTQRASADILRKKERANVAEAAGSAVRTLLEDGWDADFKPKAPGMKYKHYAPDADMLIVEGEPDDVRREIAKRKAEQEAAGKKVGVIFFDNNFELAAHELFDKLREMDKAGVDLILAGGLPESDSRGFAVMNRMLKSAGYNIVKTRK